jgi:hypothetical protein
LGRMRARRPRKKAAQADRRPKPAVHLLASQ